MKDKDVMFDESEDIDQLSEEEDEEIAEDDAPQVSVAKGCKCRFISQSMLDRIKRRHAAAAGMQTDIDCLGVLRQLVEATRQGRKLEHICFDHLQALGAHLGFQIKRLNLSSLRQRVLLFWTHKDDLTSFKTDPRYCKMFRMANRPPVEADQHRVNGKRTIRASIEPKPAPAQKQLIINEIAGSEGWKTWAETGNFSLQFSS